VVGEVPFGTANKPTKGLIMNVMQLARKAVEAPTTEVEEEVATAIAHKDIPKRVELEMVGKAVKSDAYRPQFIGALDEARTVRAKAYVPADIELVGGGIIELMVKDAQVAILDHGEVRFVWDDKDTGVLVRAFVPASEDVTVKRFNLTF